MALFKKSERIVIQVDGMTCEHCEKRVEHAAAGVDGVKKATADKDAKNVTVELAKADAGAVDSIVKAINEIGYTASK